MAVGDGLAEADQIRREAEGDVGASQVEAKAGAHVVQDQHDAAGPADGFDMCPVAIRGHFAVGENGVVVGRGDEAGDVVGVFADDLVETRCIVPTHRQGVRRIGFNRAGPAGLHPRCHAVVAAFHADDLLPPGGGASDHHRQTRAVRAVLAEYRPIRGGHLVHQTLREFHHHRRSQAHRLPQPLVPLRRGFHRGMVVAEDVRPEAAYVIDVLAAVHVDEARTFAAGEELGPGLAHGAAEVAVDAARNYRLGAFVQGVGLRYRVGHRFPYAGERSQVSAMASAAKACASAGDAPRSLASKVESRSSVYATGKL